MGSRLRRREGAWIEIERCIGCQHHQYCTSHSEEKYDKYQRELTAAVGEVFDHHRLPVEINPGPDVGTRVQQVGSDETLFKTLVRSIHSKGWIQDRTVRYPRVGAFEVWLCFRSNREEVFSKLKTGRWPNPQWLAERILKVAERLNIWDESSPSSCSVFAVPEKAETERAPRADKVSSSFVAAKRAQVTSAPRFGAEVAEVEARAAPCEVPSAKPTAGTARGTSSRSGSDLSSRLMNAMEQEKQPEPSNDVQVPKNEKAQLSSKVDSKPKEKEEKEGQDSPWDEEFEDDFEEDDVPAEGTSAAAAATNEEQKKSSIVKVPSDQDDYAADFEDDGPETAELSSGREIQPPKVPEEAAVEKIEQVEVEEGSLPKEGGIVETVPDSQPASKPADETAVVENGEDVRRQSSNEEWEDDFEPDDGEDTANGAALAESAKDVEQAAVTNAVPKDEVRDAEQAAVTNAAPKDEVRDAELAAATNLASEDEVKDAEKEEIAKDSLVADGADTVLGSESTSLLHGEMQTPNTSMPSSSQMASQSEEDKGSHGECEEKREPTHSEATDVPHDVQADTGTSSRAVQDQLQNTQEKENPEPTEAWEAEIASRTETELEDANDMEIPEVEEVSTDQIELPAAGSGQRSLQTNLQQEREVELPANEVPDPKHEKAGSAAKEFEDEKDEVPVEISATATNEEQIKSSIVKVPSDQKDYAADFEDDGPETAELSSGREIQPPKVPEEAAVEKIEQVEVEDGSLPKEGGIVETLPDSQPASQPVSETVTVQSGVDIRRQPTHDWEDDFEPDDGEDTANTAALAGSTKDAEQSAVTNAVPKDEVRDAEQAAVTNAAPKDEVRDAELAAVTNLASEDEVKDAEKEEIAKDSVGADGADTVLGSESTSLLHGEMQTPNTSMPSSSQMASQSEEDKGSHGEWEEKREPTHSEATDVPHDVQADTGTSSRAVQDQLQNTQEKENPEPTEALQAKAAGASRSGTEIEDADSMEVKGVEEVDSTEDSWLLATLGKNGQVLQLVMTSQPEDTEEVVASPVEAKVGTSLDESKAATFAFKDDYKADFEDVSEISKPSALERAGREPARFAEASPSRRSDFEDVFDDPLLSTSFGNESDSGDFPDYEDPMVEVEEEDSVPMFGDFDKERLPTVNEIDEDEEELGTENNRTPTFNEANPETGEVASWTTFPAGKGTNPRVRPTSARIRAG